MSLETEVHRVRSGGKPLPRRPWTTGRGTHDDRTNSDRRFVGNDLHFVRTFRAPIEDVWKRFTDPESTARWFGPWRWVGNAGPGNEIAYKRLQEQGTSELTATVERCEAPHHLAITSNGPYGVSYEIWLEETGSTTTMTFVHQLTDRAMAGDLGPGWEFYLDLLVDWREGRPFRKFDGVLPFAAAVLPGNRR